MKIDRTFWKRGLLRPRYNVPGSSPGMLPPVEGSRPVLSLFDFNSAGFFEARDTSISVCEEYFTSTNVTWVHVQGQPDPETLRLISADLVYSLLVVVAFLALATRRMDAMRLGN